jgi:outer membrane lipoprotein-sorting protein
MASGRANTTAARWALAVLAAVCLLPPAARAAAIPSALSRVLDHLDQAAARLHHLSAAVVSTKYTAIVADTSVERGMIYYRRGKHGPQIALDIRTPARREFLYRDQTGWLYQPGIHQVQEFDLRTHHAAVQRYLLLSFGGGGHALLRSFDVRLAGRPNLRGQATVELVLTPKNLADADGITSIELWYSPQLWVALRQQVNQVSGDYQRLDYSRIRINPHLSGHLFSPHFHGATIIRPQQ